MTERVHVLLFDVDGTLLLSGGAGRRALDGAFEELFGVPEAMKGISPNGLTDSIICREMFRTRLKREGTGEECDRLLDRYAGLLGWAVDESEAFTLMPGSPALLEALSIRSDVILGLGTGNIEQGALAAGQSCALIKEILPAGEIVERIVEEADAALERLAPWKRE